MRSLCLSLIGLGAVLSAYLLFRHLAIAGSSEPVGRGVCSLLFGAGCDDTLRTAMARQLGVPLAGLGLVYHGTLAALLFVGRGLGGDSVRETARVAFLLALAGAIASLALAATFVVGSVPLCPLCLCIHVINLGIPFVLWRLGRVTPSGLGAMLRDGARYLMASRPAGIQPAELQPGPPPTAAAKVMGYLVVALVAVGLYQWSFLQDLLHPPPEPPPLNPSYALARHDMTTPREIPIAADEPRFGPDDAPARLVVFSDFRCPGCRFLAKGLSMLAESFGNDLQVVFKHFPLDSACNEAVQQSLHPGACDAARAAEAAMVQGEFWGYHDALFAADWRTSSLDSIAAAAGLDLERFASSRASAESLASVEEDIALGIELGVDETPSVFLNGRRVDDIRLPVIQFLIAMEIVRGGQQKRLAAVTASEK